MWRKVHLAESPRDMRTGAVCFSFADRQCNRFTARSWEKHKGDGRVRLCASPRTMRSHRPGPGYLIGMARWMMIGELVEEYRVDVYALRETLGLLGLFDVGEPIPLVIRHLLATLEVDDGDQAILLWHADAAILARIVFSGGQFGNASASYSPSTSEDAESKYAQNGLLGVEAEIETVGEGDAGGSATDRTGGTLAQREAAGNAGAGPMRRIVEGFDTIVATDGTRSGSPGPSGWAWVE